MADNKPTLMMIGLDGATFEVIRPLVEAGKLPHLGRIMDEEASGVLESIIPPITGPAWSVLATGQNPGKLGTFDFINRRQQDDYRLHPIRSQDLAGHSFWDILDAAGYRVGILNYPMLVPAYPVDGWMVAGLGASRLHEYAYPETLKAELDRITGGYEINISFGLPKYRDNMPRLIEDMKLMLRNRVAVLEHLIATQPVDVLVVVFSVPDVAQHTMWKYWDENWIEAEANPLHDEMREAFVSLWVDIDRAVGEVLEHLAPEGHALIISDHGFGPAHGVFHINEWLKREGFLEQQASTTSRANRLRQWLVEKTNPVLRPLYQKLVGSKVQQLLRASVLRDIDLDDSKAFALENSDGYGGIYVNRRYARRRGLDEADFVRETARELKHALIQWGVEHGMAMQVFVAQELYRGDKAELAPEVLLLVEDGRSSVSYRMGQPIYDDRPHHPMKSGSHRLDGILLATGPRVAAVSVDGAKLQDIAPTLLSLADVPSPASIDGRVLIEMLKPEYRTNLPARVDGPTDAPEIEIGDYDEEEEAIILQRLTDLGYID